MIWNYWGLSELNNFLQDIDKSLIERLDTTLYGLEGEKYDPTQLHLKKNLIRIIEAFAPSDLFRNKKFRKHCLNLLPKNVLLNLADKLELNIQKEEFDEVLICIVALNWDDSNFAQIFLDFFSLPQHFLASKKESLPNFEDYTPPSLKEPVLISSAYKTLKDYQFHLFSDCSEKLDIPKSRFIIQMPTGAGKTRTAMELVTYALNKTPENQTVVWLAHSEELCEQAFSCFNEIWQHVAKKPLRAVRSWGNHPLPKAYDISMFIVGGFAKFYSGLAHDPNVFKLIRDRITLIVIDEAHKTVAPTYKKVIKELIAEDTAVVGLTATPGRTIIDETKELAEFYFSDLIGIESSTEISPLAMLREKNILSKTEYLPLISGRNFELTPNEIIKLECQFDFPKGFLNRVGADDIRNVEILRRMQIECANKKSILFFACSVPHSRFISAMMFYLGISSAHIDGSTNRDRRATIIEDFRGKKIQVLCNFGVLSTGFDAPNTDVVFISRPTNSAVLYSQMIGRGLRGPAIGGTENCRIIDVKDNIVGFGNNDSVYRYFNEYWEQQDPSC
jgi:superfamily II DNA or RNA helicase